MSNPNVVFPEYTISYMSFIYIDKILHNKCLNINFNYLKNIIKTHWLYQKQHLNEIFNTLSKKKFKNLTNDEIIQQIQHIYDYNKKFIHLWKLEYQLSADVIVL
jgi:hypothetical protein